MKTRGETVAILLGGAAAVMLVAMLMLASEKHLRRLRRDEDYLGKIIEKPEGTAERKAVLQYVRTKQGAQHLAKLWVGDLLDNLTLGSDEVVVFGLKRTKKDRWDIWCKRSRGTRCGITTDRRILAAHDLLLTLNPLDLEPLTFKAYEDRTFRIVDGGEAYAITGLADMLGTPPGPDRLVCVDGAAERKVRLA